jgi:AraC family transcriptional regulator, transcriptional activator of pobA
MFETTAPGTDFRMTSLARMAQGGKWRVEAMRSYARPLLLWFTRGQGRITIAGVTRGYGPHNAIFMPAGTMHGFDMVGNVHGQAIFFPRGVDLGLPGDTLHLRLRDATVQAEVTALVDAMERELNRAQPGMDRALYHHAGLVAVWLERQAAAAAPPERPRAAVRLAEAYASLVERDFRTARAWPTTPPTSASRRRTSPGSATRPAGAAPTGFSRTASCSRRVAFWATATLR